MKFRKKPLVIEAFQMTAERRQSNADWPEWLNRAWQTSYKEVGSVFPLAGAIVIHTLEGNHTVSVGDWIIKGVKGELYACKPDVFEMTYEPVVETASVHVELANARQALREQAEEITKLRVERGELALKMAGAECFIEEQRKKGDIK